MSGTEPARNEVDARYYADAPAGPVDYWRLMAAPRFRVATLLRELADEPPASVTDLGCGGGELLIEIGRRFPQARLFGIDRAAEQIEVNRRRHPQIHWIVADLESPAPLTSPVEEGFDAVVSSEVIEHLVEPSRLLESARTLVRPGGRLLLTTQSGRVGETERRVGHLRHFAVPEIRELLLASGWTPERVWNAGFPFHDLSKRLANLRPGAAMNRFGSRPYGPFERAICALLRGAFRFNSRSRGAQLFAVARRARTDE